MHSINILFPVYNEEARLENGILRTLRFIHTYMPDTNIRLTIVDNASEDDTGKIGMKLASRYRKVSYLRIREKGVGAAFRAGVRACTSDIVGYMDVDLSTDLRNLLTMQKVFETRPDVMMVNASKQAKGAVTLGRAWYRNLTSKGLTLALKLGLGMHATDAICGFKFFRRTFVEEMIRESDRSENGWFFIIELLIRTERSGAAIAEIPVTYREAEGGHVDVIRQTADYLSNIMKLRERMGIGTEKN